MALQYVNIFKSFLPVSYCRILFSRAWEASFWNVSMKKDWASPISQSLWEGGSLTSLGASLRVLNLLSGMNIIEILFFLWANLISKQMVQVSKNPFLALWFCFGGAEPRSPSAIVLNKDFLPSLTLPSLILFWH